MGLEPGGVSPWGKLLLQPILKKLSVVTHTHSGLIIHGELISAVNITDCYFPLTRFWSGSYIECNEVKRTTSIPAHLATATMNKTTTLTLTEDQLLRLLDGMESVHEPLNTVEPGSTHVRHTDRVSHDALVKRLQKALNRLEDAPAAPTSQRVHLPKVEALLNELL